MTKIGVRRLSIEIDEFLNVYEGRIGYVYPYDEEPFYVQSNVQEKLYNVELVDGSLFASDNMESLYEQGYPAETFEYDADEYHRLCEEFNASAGQEHRPSFPTKYECRVDA